MIDCYISSLSISAQIALKKKNMDIAIKRLDTKEDKRFFTQRLNK